MLQQNLALRKYTRVSTNVLSISSIMRPSKHREFTDGNNQH
jgi:hypothetical protein